MSRRFLKGPKIRVPFVVISEPPSQLLMVAALLTEDRRRKTGEVQEWETVRLRVGEEECDSTSQSLLVSKSPGPNSSPRSPISDRRRSLLRSRAQVNQIAYLNLRLFTLRKLMRD